MGRSKKIKNRKIRNIEINIKRRSSQKYEKKDREIKAISDQNHRKEFKRIFRKVKSMNENIIKRVKKLLGENITNIAENENENNFFQDLDLVILGSSEDEYKEYTQLLRKEYSHMDDINYKQMRLKKKEEKKIQANQNASIIHINDSSDEDDCVMVENSNINENNDEAVFNNNQKNINNNFEPNDPLFYCDTRPTKYIKHENTTIYNRLNINEKLSAANSNTKQIMINIDDDEITEIVPLELVNENNVNDIVPLELVNENNVAEIEKSDVLCMGEIVISDDSEIIITVDDNIEPEKRMIIVDGSNVAFSHSLNNGFSVKGLEICINHFKEMGHQVKAVMPRFRLQYNKSSNPTLLNKLHQNGNIVVTPCKNLVDRRCSSYDDRFILELASKLDAVIISNDNYSDLSDENPMYKEIIEQRVVGFAWCDDLFLVPEDPYGWEGPHLIDILHKHKQNNFS